MRYDPVFEKETPEVIFRRFSYPIEDAVEYVVSQWEIGEKEYSAIAIFNPEREIRIYYWNHLRKRWELEKIPPYLSKPITDWLDFLSIPTRSH